MEYEWLKWYECKKFMPGNEFDALHNKEALLAFPQFLVCYHHGDNEPFFARCKLVCGKFTYAEFCRAETCTDKYQDEYWDEDIEITHWMLITWPSEYL